MHRADDHVIKMSRWCPPLLLLLLPLPLPSVTDGGRGRRYVCDVMDIEERKGTHECVARLVGL